MRAVLFLLSYERARGASPTDLSQARWQLYLYCSYYPFVQNCRATSLHVKDRLVTIMKPLRTALLIGLAAASVLYVGVVLSFVPVPSSRTLTVSNAAPTLAGPTPAAPEPTVVEILGVSGELLDEPHSAQEPMRTISCPSFSGPGYDKRRHPSRRISVPTLAAPYEPSSSSSSSARHPRKRRLEALPLSDVRLLPGSAFEAAFRTNLNFLKTLSLDSLLLTFRLSAGQRWPAGSLRLMGWEHTGSELRGHFLGHWLSSAAMSYAATGDTKLAEALSDVLSALEKCASPAGYLSAFPPSFLDRLEAITPVWAPYYTLHKLLAGLLQVARLASPDRRMGGASAPMPPRTIEQAATIALRLASRLADYIDARVQKLMQAKSLDYHFETLNQVAESPCLPWSPLPRHP